jgi:hypothetical protein
LNGGSYLKNVMVELLVGRHVFSEIDDDSLEEKLIESYIKPAIVVQFIIHNFQQHFMLRVYGVAYIVLL